MDRLSLAEKFELEHFHMVVIQFHRISFTIQIEHMESKLQNEVKFHLVINLNSTLNFDSLPQHIRISKKD